MLLEQVAALVPSMQARAAALDRDAAFPAADIADLTAIGVLRAPVPFGLGGSGAGTEPGGTASVLALLRHVGRGNMAVGRVLEAHVNALKLVFRYGDDSLRQRVAHEAGQGHLFALWVTDPPAAGLRLSGAGLRGRKHFCSAAGHATRAVVTATDDAGQVRLVHVRLGTGTAVTALGGGLAGMRAAITGQVLFSDSPAMVFGAPGDYLREPDFSTGAWRTAAVTLGGMEALGAEIRTQLVARGRAADPHQRARIGAALMAVETTRLWVTEAARRAEAADAGADAVAYVGLARLAVERAGFEMIELAQRSLGIAAVMRDSPAERLCRDLATYLRQPAADTVLAEAAGHAIART